MSDHRPSIQSGTSGVRIPKLNRFLTLNDEPTKPRSTSSIPRNRSSSNLAQNAARRQSVRTHHRGEDGEGEQLSKSFTMERSMTHEAPMPPMDFPLARGPLLDVHDRKPSMAAPLLMTPQMRSQRLIGNSNPRYQWEQYWKTDKELKAMRKPIRKYYKRNNFLIQQYLYIDRLLDSSLPHNLIQEYHNSDTPETIHEEPQSVPQSPTPHTPPDGLDGYTKVKRTPRDIYKVADEQTPLIRAADEDGNEMDVDMEMGIFAPEDDVESGDRIVAVAIYVNFAANTILLILKIIVTILTSSLSVLASLVDAALDFLSTFIVWTTTFLISRADRDTENYPIGRRRLEPLGVLVFSIIIITSFFQVALEAIQRLASDDREIVQLTIPAIAIMAATVVIKALCWAWCRLIKNSSVQALAQDAVTDVVFNTFSIIFPLLGYYLRIWWLDPLGGLCLSLYVIVAWGLTTRTHILNLTGRAASADERNILLYLTMRFAHTIKHVQSLAAYHAGDKLNVEVDIVLDSEMSLRDSHDLGESLQYVLESVPGVERAFVHADYKSVNLPSHMRQ